MIETNTIKLTPELAEIAGIHAGDGYLRYSGKRKEFDVSGNIEEKEYYDHHVVPLFNKCFNTSLTARYFPHRNTYGFYCSDVNVITSLQLLGFPSGNKTTIVEVPQAILKSKDIKIITAFLRGYFDTDGCVTFDKMIHNCSEFQKKYNYYPRLMFITCSFNLSQGFHKLLLDLGFNFRTYVHKSKIITENIKYKTQITGINAVEKWMQLIGSKNPAKLSRYWIWKKFGFCPPKTTYQQRINILNGTLDPYSFY